MNSLIGGELQGCRVWFYQEDSHTKDKWLCINIRSAVAVRRRTKKRNVSAFALNPVLGNAFGTGRGGSGASVATRGEAELSS